MSDKPVAGFVAALVVAPVCVACLLGPAVVGSLIAGSWGWFTDNNMLIFTVLAILSGLGVYALKRRRRRLSEVPESGEHPVLGDRSGR